MDTTWKNSEEWKDLNETTQIKYVANKNIVVLSPKHLKKTIVPLFCPLCEFPMKTKEDGFSFMKIGTCEQCDNHWRSSILNLGLSLKEIASSKDFSNYLNKRQNKKIEILNLK